MDKETAKDYAIEALLLLAKDSQHLDAFLISSGANIKDLRIRAKDLEFLSFVLDFFMTSDELLINLSEKLNILPEQIQKARSVLAGGELLHWT